MAGPCEVAGNAQHRPAADESGLDRRRLRTSGPGAAVFPGVDDGCAGFAAVGSYLPNPWGIHDLLANIGERCADCGDEPPSSEGVVDPLQRGDSTSFVVRGGAFWTAPALTRIARRLAFPDGASQDVGFRLVADLPAK